MLVIFWAKEWNNATRTHKPKHISPWDPFDIEFVKMLAHGCNRNENWLCVENYPLETNNVACRRFIFFCIRYARKTQNFYDS